MSLWGTKKPSFRSLKRGRGDGIEGEQGLALPKSDNNLSVHALIVKRKHPLPCLTDMFAKC